MKVKITLKNKGIIVAIVIVILILFSTSNLVHNYII